MKFWVEGLIEAGERAAVSKAGPAPDVSRGSQAEAAEPVALPTGAAIAAVASSAKEADRTEAAAPTEAAETEAAAAARPSGQPSDANAVPAK